MPLQPIDSKRLYEQVADQIDDMIRRGEFKAGQRLPAERDLAKSVGVSRAVVREALVALEIAGLVEVRTGSGAYVREPKNGERMLNAGHSPTDVLNARMIVEGEAAALAAENASARDLEAMADAVRRMIADHDTGRPRSAADLAFHVAAACASGNAARHGRRAPVVRAIQSRLRHLVGARERMRAHLRQVLDVMIEDGGEESSRNKETSPAGP